MARNLFILAVLVGFAFLPQFVGEYYIELLILFMINLILACSFRLITTAGDWSLSHIVFMGVGAYATAMMAKFLGWPFWGTVLFGGLASAVIGLAVVFPVAAHQGFRFLYWFLRAWRVRSPDLGQAPLSLRWPQGNDRYSADRTG